MKTATAEPQRHISVYTDTRGREVYTVMSHGAPLCAPTTHANAVAVAKRFQVQLEQVWDGDAGVFLPFYA